MVSKEKIFVVGVKAQTKEGEVLTLDFSLMNGETYRVKLSLLDFNGDRDFTGQSGTPPIPEERKIEIYIESSDAPDHTLILDNEKAAKILTQDGINILDPSNYDNLDGFNLDNLKKTDAKWVTNTMEGRVDVRIESSSTS